MMPVHIRGVSASVGPVNASYTVNSSGQRSVSVGGGPSEGLGAQVYNTYTWSTGGVLNWIRSRW